MRIASLTLLCLALVVIPASAQVLYDNGPVNGTTDAWTINFGYVVSDSFKFNSNQTITGFDFYTWLFPGDSLLTVDWSITLQENGGTVFGQGTANVADSFVSTNQFGYDIHKESVSGINVPQLGNVVYWLNLANATSAQGNPVYWDENSGAGCQSPNCPSQASESALGTIPSEAFDLTGASTTTSTTTSTTSTGTVPEPSSIMLFGSGILGLAGLLRRKLF